MSRTELADAVNTALDQLYPGRDLTAHYVDSRWIGKLERGEHRWPSDERRAALRHALGTATDTQLGLYIPRHTGGTVAAAGLESGDWVAARTDVGLVGEMGSDDPRVSRVLAGEVARLESGGYDDWNSFSVVTSMLAQQRQAVAPATLLSLVEAHRDCLLILFQKAVGDPASAAIGAMLGEASIVTHTATGIPLDTYGRLFDTISVCLSKGLGAPAGSVLAGSHDHITEARRLRLRAGGAMRQTGILAAAGRRQRGRPRRPARRRQPPPSSGCHPPRPHRRRDTARR